jgi:hypothetical protein
MKHALFLVGVTLVTLVPSWASACAVCGTTDESAREAFLFGTIAMTFLPLVGLFFGVYLLRRWLRTREEVGADVHLPPT